MQKDQQKQKIKHVVSRRPLAIVTDIAQARMQLFSLRMRIIEFSFYDSTEEELDYLFNHQTYLELILDGPGCNA